MCKIKMQFVGRYGAGREGLVESGRKMFEGKCTRENLHKLMKE
jgi:hypothetical protein